ncbi:hypothetical protein AB0G02_08220 [Actinosynnema sp. NPDC023658]|uniref:hypothetical protein n=1 Tax=Actinosynnema sp. NPDC023658 TaxID=3155465 RepID=UPI0033FB571F
MAILVGVVFSGFSALSIEDVEDAGDVIVVRASSRGVSYLWFAYGPGSRLR